jgi:hypothetical protein
MRALATHRPIDPCELLQNSHGPKNTHQVLVRPAEGRISHEGAEMDNLRGLD